jgi:glycine dehydrogenase subunit 1
MPFIANTDEQRRQMLAEIGMKPADLFADIPQPLRSDPPDIPDGLSEQEVINRMRCLAGRNRTDLVSFLGGGFYDHFVPAAVGELVGRSEFYTAYTPYQPELSQGTLQAIYEYQSMICRLTDMEVANASLYDGGTALYEAAMMALRITGRRRIIVDECVSPIYRTILRSYTRNLDIEYVETPPDNGLADREKIRELLAEDTAAVIVSNPNFFGCLDDFSDLSEMVHEHKALLIASCYPVALGLVKTPGQMGADIVTGEGQSLGMGLNFGGPYLGYMATSKKHMRKMPGRICGRTVDRDGRDGFVLTLQAREQHIRREKATSNICTNEGLCALTALVYLSLLGAEGLREVATNCTEKASYARQRMLEIPGVQMRFPGRHFFNEFVLRLPSRAEPVIRRLIEQGVAAGFPLVRYYPEMADCLLLAVTEKRTKQEIDLLTHVLEGSL